MQRDKNRLILGLAYIYRENMTVLPRKCEHLTEPFLASQS